MLPSYLYKNGFLLRSDIIQENNRLLIDNRKNEPSKDDRAGSCRQQLGAAGVFESDLIYLLDYKVIFMEIKIQGDSLSLIEQFGGAIEGFYYSGTSLNPHAPVAQKTADQR